MTCRLKLAAISIGLAAAVSAQATVLTFDVPVTTSATQAPDTWYTDRYAPAGFQVTNFDGDNRLQHTISAADGASSRPGAFSSSFYNTQGRKYDLSTSTTSLSVDLYVDDLWASTGRRMAGLWGTAFDATDTVSFFPILEFANGQFQYWNGGALIAAGLPANFVYDDWYNLSIELVGTDWIYEIDGVPLATVPAGGSTYIGNAILQGYNTTAGVDFDIYWDNLSFNGVTAVPEPGSAALVGAALLAGWGLRRRSLPVRPRLG